MTDSPPPPIGSLRGAVDLSSLVRQPANGSPEAALEVPSLVVEGTDANFTTVIELSRTVPVIVELHAGTPAATLVRLVSEYAGRFMLATVLASANPQLAQAFHAVRVPTVAALIGGRPIARYEGDLPEAEARGVFEQLATLAAQNGVTGTVAPQHPVSEEAMAQAEPEPAPLSPHHQAAYDAISRGDYATAMKEYSTAVAQDPHDALAVAGFAQASLLFRLDGKTADAVRTAAAADPADVDAQLDVADLDVSGGHLDDAFGRLLDLFPSLDATRKDEVRARLLEYFEIAGPEDPRVAAARRRLTGLLY
jgi:putative thioredoxin